MKFLSFFIVVCNLLILYSKTINGFKNKSAAYLLYDHLLVEQGYNKYIRPIVNSTQSTVVNISLNLLNIIDFNEVTEKFTITGELKITWFDEYLTWDPVTYGGLDSINIPQNNVWKPDIGLENSVSRHGDMGTPSMYVCVRYDGYIIWNPMEVFQSTCPADVTKYPLDAQTCCLNFEAWNFASNVVQISKGSNDVMVDHGYDGLPQWFITDTTANDYYKGGDFYVTFCITLKRQSLYVMLNIILPIAMLSLLNSCVFLLPAASGEKASFSVTVFLSLSVFLTIISAQLPKTSDRVSVFNLYVFSQVMISTFITVTVLMQTRFFNRSENRKVPKWLQRMINSCHCTCHNAARENSNVVEVKSNENGVIQEKDEQVGNHEECFETGDRSTNYLTWKKFANWLDPIMFVFYSSLNALFSLGLLIWSWSV